MRIIIIDRVSPNWDVHIHRTADSIRELDSPPLWAYALELQVWGAVLIVNALR